MSPRPSRRHLGTPSEAHRGVGVGQAPLLLLWQSFLPAGWGPNLISASFWGLNSPPLGLGPSSSFHHLTLARPASRVERVAPLFAIGSSLGIVALLAVSPASHPLVAALWVPAAVFGMRPTRSFAPILIGTGVYFTLPSSSFALVASCSTYGKSIYALHMNGWR